MSSINYRVVCVGNIKLHRCGLLENRIPLDADVNALVDLRRDGYDRDTMIRYCKNKGIKYINIPLESKTCGQYRNNIKPSREDLLEFYIDILDTNIYLINKAISIILRCRSVQISCYFGKDRTGILVYLIQRLLSISRHEAEIEYVAGNRWFKENIELLEHKWEKKGLSRDSYMERMMCSQEVIRNLESYINSNYGGINEYLSSGLNNHP